MINIEISLDYQHTVSHEEVMRIMDVIISSANIIHLQVCYMYMYEKYILTSKVNW